MPCLMYKSRRIHEYKRQLLNALQVVARYLNIRANPDADWLPLVKIFSGKAAPSYTTAKLIIKLINDIAETVNNDPVIGDRLKVVYMPNYNVTRAEVIIPGADLSEQISTAGMEGIGYRQHETCPERCFDHWDNGRCKC